MGLNLLKLLRHVLKLRCRTKGQIMYKNVGVGGQPPATACKAGMQLPPRVLMAVLCMKLIAIATLSVCIALLCLSQSESLSQLAQLELDSVRTQPARPCHVQLSRHLP